MEDKRILKTRQSVKKALLVILKNKGLLSISVSEICKQAGISRSTFYAHFKNVQEVYESLIVDFLHEMRALKTQLKCRSCNNTKGNKTPFCIALRQTDTYKDVVRQPSFLDTMFNVVKNGTMFMPAINPYVELDVSEKIAEKLFIFQMSGCYTLALSEKDDASWPETQAVLDTFIAAGMNAVHMQTDR